MDTEDERDILECPIKQITRLHDKWGALRLVLCEDDLYIKEPILDTELVTGEWINTRHQIHCRRMDHSMGVITIPFLL